jgi:hypothetical protein
MLRIIEAPTVKPITKEKNPEIPKETGHYLLNFWHFYDLQQFSFLFSF